MGRQSGRLVDIGIAKESARGTTESSADYWLPYVSQSFKENILKVRDESGVGVLETPVAADIVKQWSEGDVQFNIYDDSIGLILLSLFGTESFATDTPEADVGQHTFTLSQSNSRQSLTVFKKDENETLAAGNVVVNQFTLEAAIDEYLRGTVNLIGKIFGEDSDTVSYTTPNRFRPQDLTIKLAATENELSGAAAITILRNLSLTFNTNVEDFQGLGSADPDDWHNKETTVEGSFEVVVEDDTYKDLTLLNSYRALSIKASNGQVTIGSSTNPSLELILDRVDFDNFDLDESNENLVILTANFTGHYSQANSRMARAILINDKNAEY